MSKDDEEMNRKRKFSHTDTNDNDNFKKDDDFLSLSLSFHPTKPHNYSVICPHGPVSDMIGPRILQPSFPPPLPPHFPPFYTNRVAQPPLIMTSIIQSLNEVPLSSPSETSVLFYGHSIMDEASSSRRIRRNPTQVPKESTKPETIAVPFPWATGHRARIHRLSYLLAMKMHIITGQVQCKRCEKQCEIGYNLIEKFNEIASYIVQNKYLMYDRAPDTWMIPNLPSCKYCAQENCVKPVISVKKRSINWLFLLLGQTLGCCNLEQLKYFCKHTKNHRTGAKDRVLYLTYLDLCKQLCPTDSFDHHSHV